MLKLLGSLLLLLTLFTSRNQTQELKINFTPAEMQKHKNICKDRMQSPVNFGDPNYQMRRALFTIDGDDADYIPKVENAGKIYAHANPAYQVMHNGTKIILNSYYNSQWLTDVISGLKGHHEPQEEKCFHEVLKYLPSGATMIELGAYWAYYSLWFASEVKGAKNYVIEPDPQRLEISKKNFALNNKTGIFRRGFVGPVIDRDPDIIGAQQIVIDDFIVQEKIDHVHILHADIQGSEYGMLKTCLKSLDKIDYFFISTHDKEHEPCLMFLKEHGYIIIAEHSHFESCSGDGLIVAKRIDAAGPDHIDIKKYKKNY